MGGIRQRLHDPLRATPAAMTSTRALGPPTAYDLPHDTDYVALVEVGSSRIRSALARPTGPYAAARQAIPSGDDVAGVLDRIAHAGLRDALPPRRAVVAWPGPPSLDGRIWTWPTVDGAGERVDVADELSARWAGAEVVVVSDLTAAARTLVAEERSTASRMADDDHGLVGTCHLARDLGWL